MDDKKLAKLYGICMKKAAEMDVDLSDVDLPRLPDGCTKRLMRVKATVRESRKMLEWTSNIVGKLTEKSWTS